MPHFIVECTDNIKEQSKLPELFEKVHTYLAGTGIFPIGGIRSRAHWLDTYRMADGEEDYAFVHMTLKIGSGRSFDDRKRTADELFSLIKEHFAPLFDERYLALTFELTELHPELNYKHNNVHQRFK